MENQNTNTMTNYTEDELWEMGRIFSLEDMMSYIDFPESWTEEMVKEYCETYEVVDCTPDEDEQVVEVAVEGTVEGETLRAECNFENDEWGEITYMLEK